MRGIQYLLALAVWFGHFSPAVAQDSWRSHYTRQTAQKIFDRSVRKFRENFDRQNFVIVLKKIRDGEPITKTDEIMLVDGRLRAQKIRAVYEFFDERHETPWDFDWFVISWGKLKDSLNAGTDMRDHARDLLKLIKNGALDFLEEDFEPAELKDLAEYTDRRLEKMEKWASKDRLSLNKYHRLRKGLRSIYFVLKSLKLDEGETENLVLSIKENEQKMGLIHDRMEEREMRDESVPEKLSVPAAVPSLIENSQRILLYSTKKGQTCADSLK
jgi:hypothetical protein